MVTQKLRYLELKRVVETSKDRLIDGRYIDPHTASLMINVAGRLTEKNRTRFLTMPMDRMIDAAYILSNQGLFSDV